MSHILFLLVLAFIVWRSLSKSLGRGKVVRSDSGRPASPLPASTDPQRDEIADVAEVVSAFFGQKGQERLGQAVDRAIQESKARTEIGRRPAGAIKPVERPQKKAASQAPARQRARYLLDGDGGHRQRTDRTARLQQSFRGKGLCSPR